MSGCCSFVVGAKIGCGPLRHQPPALSGTSFAQSTSSTSGAPWSAASSSSRSAVTKRWRVYGPFQSPYITPSLQSETFMPASQCQTSDVGFQPLIHRSYTPGVTRRLSERHAGS